MAKPTPIEEEAERLRNALTRRYPGLTVIVGFNDHGRDRYKGWVISFESTDPKALLGKVAPLQCHFGSSRGKSEFAGVSWGTLGIVDASKRYAIIYHIEVDPKKDGWGPRDEGLTKTMQTQVLRMLRPFIRGTWKSAVQP